MRFKAVRSILFVFAMTALSFGLKAQCGPVISSFPYNENFETAASWTSGGTNSDWAWGTPAHPTISSAGGGSKSWMVGGLTGSFYNYSQLSWIMSPCYDFSSLNYPWISFKIFWENEYKYDGLVLQSSVNGGSTWTNVGAYADPVNCLNANWYNYNNITWLTSASPKHGWTGRVGATSGGCSGGNGSNGWKTAKHCMSSLAGQPNVRFRFLFGSGTLCNSYDGIAIDDILITNAAPNVANFSHTCINNADVSFTNLSGMCPTGFLWNFDDPASGSSNTSTLTNPTHHFFTSGVHNVTLTVSGPCNAASSITLPVTSTDGSISIGEITCNGANNGSMQANIGSGPGPYSYLWGGGQTTSTISGLGPGVYNLTVTCPQACPIVWQLTLNEPALLTANATVVSNVTCNGGNNGSATVAGAGGVGSYTYSWSPGGASSATATGLSANTYTVSLVDGYGCIAQDVITITQPPPININPAVVNANCGYSNGSISTNVTGGVGSYNYLWSPGGGVTPGLSGLNNGNYSLTVTDANNCSTASVTTITNTPGVAATISSTPISCSGGNNGTAAIHVISGSSPYFYQWNSGQTSDSLFNLNSSNYCGVVTDLNGCTDTVCAFLNDPSPVTAITTGFNVCNGQTFTLSGSASGGDGSYTYYWNGGASSGSNYSSSTTISATYTVTASDGNGCTSLPYTANISVLPPLSINALSVNAICTGSSAILTASPSGGDGNYNFVWTPGSISGNNITVNPSITTTYTVTLSDGCTIGSPQDTTTVFIMPLPVVSFNASYLPACAPVCVNFIDQSTGSIATWFWDFGDGQTSNTGSPSHCYPNGGIYPVSLTVTSNFGCVNTLLQNNFITVFENPNAAFTANTTVTDISEPDIHFFDQSTGAVSWSWNFGDGNISSIQDPVHTFEIQDTFPVVLTVTSTQGCLDSAKIEVKITDGFTFYIPNAFTPDANEKNDTFIPKGTGWDLSKFDLWIFDRWGNMLFHSTDVNVGWNGKIRNSEIAQSDVYVWKVQLSDLKNEKHYYIGSVTIVK